MIKMISNWSWLLRDSSCSDAKPSLEEALQMCSGTLWLANSDTLGYFWILLESWANVWQFCYVMSWNSAVLSCIRCFSSFWYLMCWISFLIHFPLSVSVFACRCQNMMFVSKLPWKRLYLPKRLKKHPTRRGVSRSLYWGVWLSGCCERAPLPCKASKFGIKMIKMISNWSWLLRDSSCSDAKPSLEEALQMCSGTLWLANSDTLGYFWILLESWANVWQFCYVMSWNSAVQSCSRCFSSFWYLMCWMSFFIHFSLSVSVFACRCQNMMFVSKLPWKRLYLPKRLKKHPTRRGVSRSLYWGVWLSGCCERAPLPCKASKFGIKMIKMISNWSWLLRDSSCSDAKPSLEEALQMCSGTLWLANSDTFGYFWILLESWANVWQFCYVMSWNSAVQSCSRCFSSFWYLMCWMSFLIHFPLSVSVFACRCQNMMFVSKLPWKRLYLPKRLKKHPTRRGVSRSLYWGVWLLWMSTTTMQSFQVCIKLIKMISNWSWLLRDSSCSDAKPGLEEALQMCSGTLWLANSDTFGYFWILLESWANVWQFCYVMSWNSAVQSCIICFSSFWYLMCWMSFLIHFSLSVSVFCMSLSKHDVCFQASMEEAVPSKEAEEASDEKRREPFFVLRCLAVWLLWMSTTTMQSFQVWHQNDQNDLQLILTAQG